MGKGFQNTPYFGQSNNFSTFVGFPKFSNFHNFNWIIQLGDILQIPKLWTTTHYAKIIDLTKVRGVLKTSVKWLWNSMKQNNPNFFLTVYSRPKVDEFSNFWADPRLGGVRKAPTNIFFHLLFVFLSTAYVWIL